jgi:hypothetical protein
LANIPETTLTAANLRSTPFGQFEYQKVTFGVANTDVAVRHNLKPSTPGQVGYIVVQQSAAGSVYQDSTATRRAWSDATLYLRASAPMVVQLLLVIPAVETTALFRA